MAYHQVEVAQGIARIARERGRPDEAGGAVPMLFSNRSATATDERLSVWGSWALLVRTVHEGLAFCSAFASTYERHQKIRS